MSEFTSTLKDTKKS